jgi:hypothetical protein
MNDFPLQNTGVIEGSGTKSLYVGGTIPYEVRLESGDWRPYLPAGEKQKDPVETMACVSFSCNNIIEIQNNFFGTPTNYSDRFLAKVSGTTHQGNRLDLVADAARTIGLVREEEWPNNHGSWNLYYSDIPQDVINKAVKQPIQYEATDITASNLKKELKQAPLQVLIPAPHPNHAVTLVHIDGNTAYYFDHYAPFLKTMDISKITYALKIVLTPQNMTNALIVKNGSEYGLFLPATSSDGFITLLRIAGLPVPLKADGTLDFDKIKVDKQLV